MTNNDTIEVYTDGSCDTKHKTGAWTAVILTLNGELILKGIEQDTTHNRMELIAALKAVDYIKQKIPVFKKITIYSDSQYLVDLERRKVKFIKNNFLTKSGKPIQNKDLVETIIDMTEKYSVKFIKVKAHQKEGLTKNHNRTADKICRQMVRNEINKRCPDDNPVF